MIVYTTRLGQAFRETLRDQLLLDCSQSLAPVDSFAESDMSSVAETADVPYVSVLNAVPLQGLGEIVTRWIGDLVQTSYNPHAFETVTNTDVSAAVAKCSKSGFDEILRAACICSFLANRAVINENPVNHQWFTEDQGYQQLDFDKILRYYVQVASTGTSKTPAFPFYTQDPEKVIKALANTLKSNYSEDYIRVVFYWLSRTWTSIVQPADMELSEANRSSSCQAA